MKKISLWFLGSLYLIMLISYIDYYRYSKVINDFVGSVVTEVSKNYPNVNEEELIKIVNGSNKDNNEILKKYGFTDSDINYLSKMNDSFYKNIVINLIMFSVFGVVCISVYVIEKKKRCKEIDNITNYLKRINDGIYDLEIIDNIEGDLSILKNEVYTTTVSLKSLYAKENKEKIKIKDNLANISHQLKTPLTSIMIMIDTLLEEHVSKEKQKEYLNDIRIQIENINFLIIAMLKLSRFDANVVVFEKREIIVKDLLFDVLKNVDILRELKNINIHVSGKSDVVFDGDYKWECEAITNILKNGIEYSKDNGDIYVNYKDNGMYVSIDIIDNGKGICNEDMKHIFDRFYKKNNNSNNFGIGLSLAKEIIERDNGTIRVSSNNGTKFSIRYYK